MTYYEVIVRYKWLMEEAWTLNKQAERVLRIGTPAGISIYNLTGMPHGTNDKEAADIQAFDGYVQQLKKKVEEIMRICGKFEHALEMIIDDKQRDICRKYYALGMTDEQIGNRYHLERSGITQLRNNAIEKLKNSHF